MGSGGGVCDRSHAGKCLQKARSKLKKGLHANLLFSVCRQILTWRHGECNWTIKVYRSARTKRAASRIDGSLQRAPEVCIKICSHDEVLQWRYKICHPLGVQQAKCKISFKESKRDFSEDFPSFIPPLLLQISRKLHKRRRQSHFLHC